MPPLDIILVNPGGRRQGYQSLSAELAGIEPPIWAALLAEHLRRRGFGVEIVDADAEELSPEQVADRVAARRPLLAAVIVFGANPSASTQKMPAAGAICRAIRAACPATPVALGGLHVSALPERTMREEAVDFVIQGEGPYTLAALLEVLRGGTPVRAVSGMGVSPVGVSGEIASPGATAALFAAVPPVASSGATGETPVLQRVPGLWYRREERIVSNPPAELVADFDVDLPQAAWDLLPMHRYRAHNWHCFGHAARRPYAVLYTSLGCPYRCSFCCINALFGRGGIRFRGVEAVLAEVDLLVRRYGVRHIKILDELFVIRDERVEAICDGLIARDYGLNIWAYARVDTVKPPLLEKLRRSGVTWLAYGFESASRGVRDGVGKGFDDDRAEQAVVATRAAGIHIIANFIFGLPDDDLSTMQATLDWACRHNFEFANFYCAMAYPGSQLYRQALAEGWALPETWAGYSQLGYETLPLPTRHLSPGQVLAFRDRAFVQYFSRPEYQEMIERRFGPEAARQVRQMLQAGLARRHAT